MATQSVTVMVAIGTVPVARKETLSLLTVREVCEELGITSSTWDKWRARRVGPPTIVLPNGSLRVRRTELEHWLLDREVA
jgi:predicted DNA-binding transcriptional regulator AlpA